MDEATFNKEVEFISYAYGDRQLTHRQFVARAYEGLIYEGERRDSLDCLIDQSKTLPECWEAVNLIGRRHLRRGDPLPAALAHWIRDVLADQGIKRQKDKLRARPPGSRRGGVRDQKIRMAIKNLSARGFQETRRGGPPEACSEGGSACDIAGAAFGLNYKNTERIWGSRTDSMAS